MSFCTQAEAICKARLRPDAAPRALGDQLWSLCAAQRAPLDAWRISPRGRNNPWLVHRARETASSLTRCKTYAARAIHEFALNFAREDLAVACTHVRHACRHGASILAFVDRLHGQDYLP